MIETESRVAESPLTAAFTEDHRSFTRGLSRILKALKSGDDATAVRLADELDRAVGPHIEFEEQVFYPEVAKSRGKEFTRELYREHRVGQSALKALLEPGRTTFSAAEREDLVSRLETAMDHALSCGTLLSHITTRGEAEQERMLQELRQASRRGRRWTELPAGG